VNSVPQNLNITISGKLYRKLSAFLTVTQSDPIQVVFSLLVGFSYMINSDKNRILFQIGVWFFIAWVKTKI